MKHTRKILALLLCLLVFPPLAPAVRAQSPAPVPAAREALIFNRPATLHTYDAGGVRYIALRDAAMLFRESEGAFSIDGESGLAAVLTPGGVYQPIGGENKPLAPVDSGGAFALYGRLTVGGQRHDVPALFANGRCYYSLPALCGIFGLAIRESDLYGRLTIRHPGTPYTILVDAGHGGTDPGAVSRYIGNEEAINYDVAVRLSAMLREAGFNVVESRGQHETLALDDRRALIMSLRPDLVVSVHHNASNRHNTAGSLVMAQVGDEDGGPSRDLADLVNAQNSLLGRFVRPTYFRYNDWGGNYYAILRAAAAVQVPAIISEYAYIDHASDYRAVDTPEERTTEAAALYRAVTAWFRLHYPD